MKNAIITFGVGYEFEHIKYFVHSCYLHAPEADVYIFVGKNIDALTAASASYPRVHLIRYQENIFGKVISKLFQKSPVLAKGYARFLKQIYISKSIPDSLIHSFATPLTQFMVKRFFLIRKLMRKLPHERIMLTDIRDVLIQADPFQSISENMIATGIEPVKVGACDMNSKWITKTYSQDHLDGLSNDHIACAGVTIGSRKAIEQYVAEMIEDIYGNLDKIIGMLGADQAIHITLFYQRLKGLNKHFHANGTGSIATLHFSTLQEFQISEGQVNNLSGQKLAVIHQYDRHEQLAEYLKRTLDQSMRNTFMIAA